MKNIIFSTVLILISGYALSADLSRTTTNGYIEAKDTYIFKLYVPVIHDGSGEHRLIDAPQLLTEELMASMEQYLIGTGYISIRINGRLYIENSLTDDRELLYNFTNKAKLLIK